MQGHGQSIQQHGCMPTTRVIVFFFKSRRHYIVLYHSFSYCLFVHTSLLWETLTGREHLLFYGRLKNLKGSDLNQVCYLYFASLAFVVDS